MATCSFACGQALALVLGALASMGCSDDDVKGTGASAASGATGTGGSAGCALIQPASESKCGTEDGKGCKPDSDRVDLCKPTFSNPANVTNPLYPISDLHSVIFNGKAEGFAFRSETTLLHDTMEVAWDGQMVTVAVQQYLAFRENRIEEIAIDRFAQADDGSVWYLGEDVSDYQDGVVYTHEGTWSVADYPIALAMPASPKVGNAYRAENAAPAAFEEITITSLDVTEDGPLGPVSGIAIGQEFKSDHTGEEKAFAPGYGEFRTGSGDDYEPLALSVPKDALSEPTPAELEGISTGADTIFAAADTADWPATSTAADSIAKAWTTYGTAHKHTILDPKMTEALDALKTAVTAKSAPEARQAAIEVARLSLDFQLRYRPPVEIDLGRFDLWARQILVDAAAADTGSVKGDVEVLGFVRDRFAHALGGTDVASIDALLEDLHTAADGGDLAKATTLATDLRAAIAGLKPAG